MERITSEILTSIDVLNTMGGGIVEPRVRLSQFPEYRQIEVWAPAIPEQQMKVEIHNNQLTVYYNMMISSGVRAIRMPKVVYNKQIPYFINQEKIKATFEEDRLVVVLPFNELANGYHRDIVPVSNH